MWRLTITDAQLGAVDPNGAAWDVGSGPDIYVCVTTPGGTRRCTDPVNDSYMPAWTSIGSNLAPASSFLSPGPTFEVFDDDPIADERVCVGAVSVPRAAFAAGRGSFACGAAITVNYSLLPAL